jgi:hypothetical protein
LWRLQNTTIKVDVYFNVDEGAPFLVLATETMLHVDEDTTSTIPVDNA